MDAERAAERDFVVRTAQENDVKFIRLWFTDILGHLKGFAITVEDLEDAIEQGVGFDGAAIEGFARIDESDMRAFPDPTTFTLLPWRPRQNAVARMFCDIRTPQGEPFIGDPRYALKRNLEKLASNGYTYYVGPELEFFYLKDSQTPEPLDQQGYYDQVSSYPAADLRRDTVLNLADMGIPVKYSHHEGAHSQHEIDLKYSDALRMADNLQTYKWLVKEIARRNGIHATFMPKPLSGQNGSGMHVHLSIFNDETSNAFYDATDPHHLSKTARHFLAGVLANARGMCLITNQWYNSYKRLVPGYEAPVYIAWAERNRSALVRIPMYKPGNEVATRIELRFPDAACNPYLAFAVMLSSGLQGLEDELPLADPVTDDLYKYTSVQREQQGIDSLPHDLYDAVQAVASSEVVRATLGDHVLDKLLETKLAEYDGYRLHVSHREFDESINL